MADAKRFVLVLIGLLILGGVAFLIAVQLDRWPRARKGFLRLGDAIFTFALGLIGYVLVLVILRAFGWLPIPQ